MHIVSVANQKGGVGKSTTVHALGARLHGKGYRVLFVDLDPQCNLSNTLKANDNISIYEILANQHNAKEAIQKANCGDVIASSSHLSSADMHFNATGKEYLLKEVLQPLSNDYDYVIIDTPPALGILTINALTTSNDVIIPSQAEVYSLHGISKLSETISTVRKYCNQNLMIAGILITKYTNRLVINKDMAGLIRKAAEQIHTIAFQTIIRENVAIKEAQAQQVDIFTYSPSSNAANDYVHFTDEFLAYLKKEKN
jgi:chromosome partitioning protein